VLNPGNGQPLSVLFTPTDNSDYTTASAQVHINVLATDTSVAVTTTAPTIYVGATAQYTVVVTANGPGSSSNVVLTDTLPAGLGWTVSGPDAGACLPASPVAGGTTLTCNFGVLAAGATRTITLAAPTTVMACGEMDNSATVTATGDANATNNTSGPVAITVTCPSIAVSNNTSTPTISAGATATYNVAVTAGGTGNSNNVVLTDTLPAGLTWTVSGPDAAGCSPASPVAGGATLTCNYGALAPGTTKNVTLTAATTAANCGTINNTATVSDALDVSPGDNSAGPVAISVKCPDVAVAASTSTPTINAGSTASYTVVVSGNGPGAASNVTLTDTVPAGLTWTVGGPDGAACGSSSVAGGTALNCNFGTVAAGATRTITLSAVTSTANCGTLKDTATVTADGDTNPGDNSSGPVPITVSCPIPPATTSVSLTCPNVSLVGNSFAVSGSLSPGSVDTVTIQYTSPTGGSTTHTTQSNASGAYSDNFTPNVLGPWTVQASADGISSQACPVVVYDRSSGGTFVIGDENAILGNSVDFWGSQWWTENTWSGGVNPGVASLKGYLDAVTLPAQCGGSWSTRPGNSSKPPASVPQYMAVIVSSYISKNGPMIAGDVVGEVIVRTDPGYGPAPGHDGTGTATIVAVSCHK